MFSKSKYIVGTVNGAYGGLPSAIVFDESVTHADVACVFVPGTITGAGFCHYDEDKVHVYGESTSINIKSDPIDEIFVGRAMSHPKYAI